MEYRSIDFVAFFSGLLSVASAIGAAVVRVGPWAADPFSQTSSTIMTISFLAFGMVSLMANNVSKILGTQADQIAALQRQLTER